MSETINEAWSKQFYQCDACGEIINDNAHVVYETLEEDGRPGPLAHHHFLCPGDEPGLCPHTLARVRERIDWIERRYSHADYKGYEAQAMMDEIKVLFAPGGEFGEEKEKE